METRKFLFLHKLRNVSSVRKLQFYGTKQRDGITISHGDRTEWCPVPSVIIASDRQNGMSAERESNLFSRTMIEDGN